MKTDQILSQPDDDESSEDDLVIADLDEQSTVRWKPATWLP